MGGSLSQLLNNNNLFEVSTSNKLLQAAVWIVLFVYLREVYNLLLLWFYLHATGLETFFLYFKAVPNGRLNFDCLIVRFNSCLLFYCSKSDYWISVDMNTGNIIESVFQDYVDKCPTSLNTGNINTLQNSTEQQADVINLGRTQYNLVLRDRFTGSVK
ncbi:unnamed protein product [Trichobilharzia regenti]|nr:unnamed protein product [Trichobilharzia regenti]